MKQSDGILQSLFRFLQKYLVVIVIAAAALLVALYFIRLTVFRLNRPALSVAILTDDPSRIDCGKLENELFDYIGLTKEKDLLTVTAYDPAVPQTEQILITQMRAHAVDLVIAEQSVFMVYADKQCFGSLKDLLPTDWPDGSYKWVPNTYPAYGLRLPHTSKIGIPERDRGSAVHSAYAAGIAISSEHKDNAARALRYFL